MGAKPNLNLVGERYGSLVVLRRAGVDATSLHVQWLCRCDCGEEKIIPATALQRKATISCTCVRSARAHKHNWRKVKKRKLPRGVYKRRNRYHAAIGVDMKLEHLGYFDTPEEAHAAYLERAEEVDGRSE